MAGTSRSLAALSVACCCCILASIPAGCNVHAFSTISQAEASQRRKCSRDGKRGYGRGTKAGGSRRPRRFASPSPCVRGKRGGDATAIDGGIHEDARGGESFALRMQMHQQEETADGGDGDLNPGDDVAQSEADDDEYSMEDRQHDRRVFLNAMLSGAAFGAFQDLSMPPPPASAYEKSYPVDLDFAGDGDASRDLAAVRVERIAAQKARTKEARDELVSNPLGLRPKDFLGSAVWAVALWFLSGSRSNPLVTPLANVVYDEDREQWLKDRNEGLFAPLPAGFLLLMGLVFLALGIAVDRSILLLADGDKDICLQLAGVSLIGGGSLELGRIASGEKASSREDSDRDDMLEQEFIEFAESRLIPGGNCHRSEVAAAFRRYNAKYRVENDQYPLSDLEIERLARAWAKRQGGGMSSAGFFNGIQINNQADAFANR